MSESVLVFETRLLEKSAQPGSFWPDAGFLSKILPQAFFIEREVAEHDPSLKQLIPYSLLRIGEQVFHYRRSKGGGESRLYGLYSLGVGGHVNPLDQRAGPLDQRAGPLDPRTDPLIQSTVISDPVTALECGRERELAEEFGFQAVGLPRLVGVINDDSNEVGRVHFGVVYEVLLASSNVVPREAHSIAACGFTTAAELAQNKGEYESWSQVVIESYLLPVLGKNKA